MESQMKTVHIYTDGACSGNPGPGGWGAILRYNHHEKEISGWAPRTTNNRMELLAAIRALETLKEPCNVIITTDSQYLQKGITEWMKTWKKRGWTTASRKPVKNKELWILLDRLCSQHKVQWDWVKGHDGHCENERADQLARQAILRGKEGAIKKDELG